MSTAKENTEAGFITILACAFLTALCYALYKLVWINLIAIISVPAVTLWLKRYYQYRFQEEVLKNIKAFAIIASLAFAIILMANKSKTDCRVAELFLNGTTKNRIVHEENDEGEGYHSEKRYAFFPANPKDEWKLSVIEWTLTVLLIIPPIVTIKHVNTIKNNGTQSTPRNRIMA